METPAHTVDDALPTFRDAANNVLNAQPLQDEATTNVLLWLQLKHLALMKCELMVKQRELKAARSSSSISVPSRTSWADHMMSDDLSGLLSRIMTKLNVTHMTIECVLTSVLKTCREMLLDRGVVPDEDDILVETAVMRMESMYPVISGSGAKSVAVYFMIEERVSVKNMCSIMEDNPLDTIIFVSSDGPTTFAKKEASNQWGYRVQFFRYQDLCINITHHVLVPKHSLCTSARQYKDENYPHPRFRPGVSILRLSCRRPHTH